MDRGRGVAEGTGSTWLSSAAPLRKAFFFFFFLPLQTVLLFVWRRRAVGMELGVSCGLHVWLELPEICRLITPRWPQGLHSLEPQKPKSLPTSSCGGGGFKGKERRKVCVPEDVMPRKIGDSWTKYYLSSPTRDIQETKPSIPTPASSSKL